MLGEQGGDMVCFLFVQGHGEDGQVDVLMYEHESSRKRGVVCG